MSIALTQKSEQVCYSSSKQFEHYLSKFANIKFTTGEIISSDILHY